MDLTVATYLLYLAVTGPLTVWVARALQRHGKVFLVDVFHGDERLAGAVNYTTVAPVVAATPMTWAAPDAPAR